MVARKIAEEKRKNRRYKAIEGAYASVSPNSHKLGQIIDISMGGLSFKYMDPSSKDKQNTDMPNKTIFLSSMGYYVGDLPFKTVADYV